MTLLQTAYERINNLPEEKIKQVIIFIDLLESNQNVATYSKSEKIDKFLSTAGKIQIDEQAIYNMREMSMI